MNFFLRTQDYTDQDISVRRCFTNRVETAMLPPAPDRPVSAVIRGCNAVLCPQPAKVRSKAENTLHGPCHKKGAAPRNENPAVQHPFVLSCFVSALLLRQRAPVSLVCSCSIRTPLFR